MTREELLCTRSLRAGDDGPSSDRRHWPACDERPIGRGDQLCNICARQRKGDRRTGIMRAGDVFRASIHSGNAASVPSPRPAAEPVTIRRPKYLLQRPDGALFITPQLWTKREDMATALTG